MRRVTAGAFVSVAVADAVSSRVTLTRRSADMRRGFPALLLMLPFIATASAQSPTPRVAPVLPQPGAQQSRPAPPPRAPAVALGPPGARGIGEPECGRRSNDGLRSQPRRSRREG